MLTDEQRQAVENAVYGRTLTQANVFALADLLSVRQPAAIDKQCTCKGVLGHSRQCAMFDESMMSIAAPLANEESKPAAPSWAPVINRNFLGQIVREAWVKWAKLQPSPKPSWLAPYDELSEADKEADRQIGEAVLQWVLSIKSATWEVSPSVEQDERGAFEAAFKARVGQSISFDKVTDDEGDERYTDEWLQGAWIGWQARAPSTSANVAQGAEAVSDDHAAVLWRLARMTEAIAWTAELRKAIAPPSPPALTDAARKLAAKAIVEVYLGFPAPDREPCELDLKAADAAYAALTAAQSASGDTK